MLGVGIKAPGIGRNPTVSHMNMNIGSAKRLSPTTSVCNLGKPRRLLGTSR